jgi:cytidine deaminase
LNYQDGLSAVSEFSMTNEELIDAAAEVVRPRTVDERLIGDVGSALLTHAGNVYRGVCIDTGSGTGFCAEASAIAAMVTAGESRLETIVAVWKDALGSVVVLPPCGRCREFIRQIDPANLDARVVLGRGNVVVLKELLPYHAWPT